MAVAVNFETKGTYLMTFTVINSTYPTTTAAEFVIEISGPSSFNRQKFLDKNPGGWQHLHMFAEVAKPGEYFFVLRLEAEGRPSWDFSSCDVTTLKE